MKTHTNTMSHLQVLPEGTPPSFRGNRTTKSPRALVVLGESLVELLAEVGARTSARRLSQVSGAIDQTPAAVT